MRCFYRPRLKFPFRPRQLFQTRLFIFGSSGGFTLLELLVTLAIVLIILVAVAQFIGSVDQAWKTAATDPYAEAEDAFATITENLAGATLEPYQDYADRTGAFGIGPTTPFTPDHLARRSDLDFICGPGGGASGLLAGSGRTVTGSAVFFTAPQGYTQMYAHTGMQRLLNALGYLVEFGDDTTMPAFILPGHHAWRWRLKQVSQPAESLQIFSLATSAAWIGQVVPNGTAMPVLAQNIVTLIILPERSASDTAPALAPTFSYDSRDASQPLTRNQLPPRLRVVLVAMDENSAAILENRYGSNPPPLVPTGLFAQASQLDADLASLDGSLTAQKIGHRIFQREILLRTAAWSNTASP